MTRENISQNKRTEMSKTRQTKTDFQHRAVYMGQERQIKDEVIASNKEARPNELNYSFSHIALLEKTQPLHQPKDKYQLEYQSNSKGSNYLPTYINIDEPGGRYGEIKGVEPAIQSTHVVQAAKSVGGENIVSNLSRKVPDLFDLLTSSRRQDMLFYSTWARQNAKSADKGNVNVNNITLLHATYIEEGSKTLQRKAKVIEQLKNQEKPHLGQEELEQLIPSVDPIQIAKFEGKYITLQGVGRVKAIQLAAQELNKDIEIEVALYDLDGEWKETLEGIAKTYEGNKTEEDWVSRIKGTVRTLGVTSVLGAIGYFALRSK